MSLESPSKPSLSQEIRRRVQDNGHIKLPDKVWSPYGSPITDYERTFAPVLDDISIKSFVVQRKSPVVLDIMSPSDALRSLFKDIEGEDRLGIAVSFNDLRSVSRKVTDYVLKIKQIRGDIMTSLTWKEIESNLKGKKADLIMERAWGGLDTIPDNEKFHAIMINKMWNLLTSDNGMILSELPLQYGNSNYGNSNYRQLIELWVEYLNKMGIRASVFIGDERFYPVIRIDKTPNSPEKLPFLQ